MPACLLLSTAPTMRCCSHTSTATLIHSFVASRLDYCSSLCWPLVCSTKLPRSCSMPCSLSYWPHYLNSPISPAICATSCAGSPLCSESNTGWLHWSGAVCGSLVLPILSSSVITLSARSSHSLCSTEQDLLHVLFARASTRQKRDFLVIGLLLKNRSLFRTLSEAFLSLNLR